MKVEHWKDLGIFFSGIGIGLMLTGSFWWFSFVLLGTLFLMQANNKMLDNIKTTLSRIGGKRNEL